MRIYSPVAVLLAISFALAGCMPLPWKSEEPRIEEQELKPFTIGVSTREDVQAALGKPDLVRRDNQLWIYGWYQGHGKFVGLAPVQLFAVIPFQTRLYHTSHVLFVEYDTAGVLHDIDLVEGENACSKEDVCVKHWDVSFHTGGGLVASDETTARLDESVSIITASHNENQRARHFRPNNNSCGFYLLANELIEDRVGIDGNLLLFSIDGYKDKPLDEDTYVFQELTPGTKALLLSLSPPSPSNLERQVHKEFECRPGDVIYVAASVKLHFLLGNSNCYGRSTWSHRPNGVNRSRTSNCSCWITRAQEDLIKQCSSE